MNIQQIKLVTWIAALAAGGGLGWEVWDFFQRKTELEAPLDGEKVQALLKDGVVEPEPLANYHVDTKDLTRIFHAMDWSAKPKPKTVAVEEDDTPTEKPKVSVASLLMVLALQEDRRDPSQSIAYVKFLHAGLKAKSKSVAAKLKIDQRLEAPFAHIRVAEITSDNGIKFSFDDKDREDEFVSSIDFPTNGAGIVMVGEGGAVMPRAVRRIERSPGFVPLAPKRTTQVGRNEFRIGSETASTINRDFSVILSRDIEYRRARNSTDGSVKGIQITKVAPNSLPAQHGITSGEIVKSINGHPVKSVSDAVAYVKKESSTTDEWLVVFEKQGREFTRTYTSPDE